MRTAIGVGLILIAMMVPDAWGDLTGRWSCNDGGTYYLRQTGSRIHWYGEAGDAQPAWSSVFSGQFHEDRIKGTWADVPKGRRAGSGDLELIIEKDGTALRAVEKTGGFGGSRWTRMPPAAASVTQTLEPLKPTGKGDCIHFDPAAVTAGLVNGRWKLVSGDHWLFDFGTDQTAARKSLNVIRYYRIDRTCFIGRSDSSFSYMLAKGGSPSGAMAGEDCLAFDPKTVRVSRIQGSWKIVSDKRWLFDFGQSQSEARQALAVIRRHGFSRACFVGRHDAGFSYLRR